MSDPIFSRETPGLTSGTPQTPAMPDVAEARALARQGGDAPPGEPGGATRQTASVDHVVDVYRRYPGELITFHTRVQVHAALPGFTLQVHLPPGLEVDGYHADDPGRMPVVTQRLIQSDREPLMLTGTDGGPFPVSVPERDGERMTSPAPSLIWRVAEAQEAGASFNFAATALVLPAAKPVTLRSTALLTTLNGDEQILANETVEFSVQTKGRYLEYLPALFEQDDFMARFLMLFESFWRPIDRQIQGVEQYFDPDMTPAVFLPWLASWFNLTLDESWAEDQQRELLGLVMWLYRRRGTRVALQRYLEIFTRRPVEIVERRARNFALGKGARLGVGVALGRSNQPHTFTVKVQLPGLEPPTGMDAADAQKEVERREAKRRALIHRLIRAEKPAHTSYHLEIVDAE